MVWYEAAGDLWEIIDIIANDLIGDAAWEEGDATWDTTTKTVENARRVCHHIADDIWLSLIQSNFVRRAGTQAYYAKGLIIIISDAWNAGTHEPDGNKQLIYVPFEADNTVTIDADLADFQIVYKLFTSADGFALVGIPPINAADVYQSNFIVIVERISTKLYADGYSNFYIFVNGNNLRYQFNTYACGAALFGETVKMWRYSRPFHIQEYETTYYNAMVHEERMRIYSAYKSLGDSKAYYMKPILHNELGCMYPWALAEFWIPIDNVKGNLADDDEIALPAPQTKTYQVTLKQSPDSAAYIYYAIIKTV